MTLRVNGTESTSGAPTGAAGGDLGGTYPNPTVTDLTITSEARGDLLRRNASAWGRFAAATVDTFVGGDGTDVVARTAAQARTSVQAAGRTTDAMDGTGWTSLTPASGSSTTWASSKLTLSIPSSVTVSGASGVHRADALADPDSYDLLYRVDVVTGDGTAAPNTGNVYCLVGRDAGNCFIVAMNADGSLSIGRSSGGSWAGAYVTPAANTITSGERTGGQLWFRVSRRPGVVTAAFGVGSAGAVPTQWTTLYVGTGTAYDALDLSYGTFVRIGADTFGTAVVAGWVVDVLAIRTSAQNSAPL